MRAIALGCMCLRVEAAGFAPSETVFPATTRVWVSTPDPRRLQESFDNTDYGQLLRDPQMRPFVESVRDQARKAGRQRLGKLGLSFEDLSSVPGGEVALGVIEPAAGKLATVTKRRDWSRRSASASPNGRRRSRPRRRATAPR